jgi:hypothetical protein
MRLSRMLLVLGVAAIPLWYIYRTLEDQRVRKLEWSEVFMTEDARKEREAQKKQQAKEEAEAERLRKATELAQETAEAEKATAARKLAETKAAEAQAKVIEAQNAKVAAAAREQSEQERRVAEGAAARVRLESEKTAKQQAITVALRTCSEKTAAAEATRKRLLTEQQSYLKFFEGISKVSLPPDVPVTTIAEALNAKNHSRRDATSAIRMLYAREALKVGDPERQRNAGERCDANANAGAINTNHEMDYDFGEIESVESKYLEAIENLKRSRSDLSDVVDFAAQKLGESIGDEVRSAHAREVIDRGKYWKEPQ